MMPADEFVTLIENAKPEDWNEGIRLEWIKRKKLYNKEDQQKIISAIVAFFKKWSTEPPLKEGQIPSDPPEAFGRKSKKEGEHYITLVEEELNE